MSVFLEIVIYIKYIFYIHCWKEFVVFKYHLQLNKNAIFNSNFTIVYIVKTATFIIISKSSIDLPEVSCIVWNQCSLVRNGKIALLKIYLLKLSTNLVTVIIFCFTSIFFRTLYNNVIINLDFYVNHQKCFTINSTFDKESSRFKRL